VRRYQLRSAFGAGSLDGVELVSVELGAALDSLGGGVLVEGMLVDGEVELDGDVVVDGDVDGVVEVGPAVGFCADSAAGAPCVGGLELLSVVCAYAKLIAPTIVAAATAVVNVFEAVISILLRGQEASGLRMGGAGPVDDQLPSG
jgi:hypothetical protein